MSLDRAMAQLRYAAALLSGLERRRLEGESLRALPPQWTDQDQARLESRLDAIDQKLDLLHAMFRERFGRPDRA